MPELKCRPASFTISIVIPVFNEEDSIDSFLDSIKTHLAPIAHARHELIFINDGSTDGTLLRLITLRKIKPEIAIINFTRNFGKEAALTAGLNAASGDVVIPIDVDLQDPPAIIHSMISRWKDGYDVVLGQRIDRNEDSLPKKISASLFYKLHSIMANPKIPENVGDFRLMDKKVVEALKLMPESCRFMKGLLAWVGFDTTIIEFSRAPRLHGKSKFNGWKLWNFAIEGFTSFSTIPLRVWTYIGLIIAATSIGYATIILTKTLIQGISLPGYASMMVMLTFLGGVQLIGVGILGEYIGRIYIESKRRPNYLVYNYSKSNLNN